jgi:hypothetical protein
MDPWIILLGIGFVAFMLEVFYQGLQRERDAANIIGQLRDEKMFDVPLTPQYLMQYIEGLHEKHARKILCNLQYKGALRWDDTVKAFFVLEHQDA